MVFPNILAKSKSPCLRTELIVLRVFQPQNLKYASRPGGSARLALCGTRRLATELSFEPCAQAGQVTQLAMRFVKEYVRATESDGEYYADLIDRVLPHLMALRRAALGRGTRCSMCTASCDLGISVACAGGRKRTNQQKLHDADTPLATPLGGAKTSWAVHAVRTVRKPERRKFQVH